MPVLMHGLFVQGCVCSPEKVSAHTGTEVAGENLRVRELGHQNWAGKVFMDSQRVIDPVSSFVGDEKLAVSVLVGPETKTVGTQAVITVRQYKPGTYEFSEEFHELVVTPATTCSELRR